MSYDSQNIFARILRGEIPCQKLYENDHALVFRDIHPKAPVHVLVIPKGPFVDHSDFVRNATDEQIAGFDKAVGEAARLTGAAESGYRLISNCGVNAHQEVPHYHVHVLGGRALGPMLVES